MIRGPVQWTPYKSEKSAKLVSRTPCVKYNPEVASPTGNSRCIQEIMATMRTKNCLLQFRDALTPSVLLLILPAVCLAQEEGRLQLSAPALQAARIIGVEPLLARLFLPTAVNNLGTPGVSRKELSQAQGYAPSGPQPPCGKEPIPPYPGLDDSPIVKSWSESEFGRDWSPPACTGWAAVGFTTLVTTVARFRHTSEAEGLLQHIGAISELAGMRYWSTTHKQWQTLISAACALTDLQLGQRRGDFMPDEMTEGTILYFEQVDNLSGKAIYRMHIAEVSADRIVFEVENVSTLRYLFIPIFHPGEMQSIYFLDRESDSVWRYYSIVRTGKLANHLIARNESSSINRAVAFYRHLVGIPTDREPPAAR
jgi:hypothetical protein